MNDNAIRRELVWLVSQIKKKIVELKTDRLCPTCRGLGITGWFKRCTCVKGFKNQNILDLVVGDDGQWKIDDIESLRIRAMSLALSFPVRDRPKVADRVKWPLRLAKRRS